MSVFNSPTISKLCCYLYLNIYVFFVCLLVLLALRGTRDGWYSPKFELRQAIMYLYGYLWVYLYVCVSMHSKIARYLYTFNILARMSTLKHLKSYFKSHLFFKVGANYETLGFSKCLEVFLFQIPWVWQDSKPKFAKSFFP